MDYVIVERSYYLFNKFTKVVFPAKKVEKEVVKVQNGAP